MTYTDINTSDIEANLIKGDSVKQSVKNILSVCQNSLPGKPEFGCNLQNYIFAQVSAFTKVSIREEVKSSLYKFDERISDVSVKVEQQDDYSLSVTTEYETATSDEVYIVTTNLRS
jgi:phage baseplate assembly protein W